MAKFIDKYGVPVGWNPETPYERVVRLRREREFLIAKEAAQPLTNAEAHRIVEIDGLCAAICGSIALL